MAYEGWGVVYPFNLHFFFTFVFACSGVLVFSIPVGFTGLIWYYYSVF